jgi:hypothetical protein
MEDLDPLYSKRATLPHLPPIVHRAVFISRAFVLLLSSSPDFVQRSLQRYSGARCLQALDSVSLTQLVLPSVKIEISRTCDTSSQGYRGIFDTTTWKKSRRPKHNYGKSCRSYAIVHRCDGDRVVYTIAPVNLPFCGRILFPDNCT